MAAINLFILEEDFSFSYALHLDHEGLLQPSLIWLLVRRSCVLNIAGLCLCLFCMTFFLGLGPEDVHMVTRSCHRTWTDALHFPKGQDP